MFAKRVLVKGFGVAKKFQTRNHGGFLTKNIRVEENAGLREITYIKWCAINCSSLITNVVFIVNITGNTQRKTLGG